MPETPPLTKELPPLTIEQQEQAFIKDFFELCDVYDYLRKWTPSGFKQLIYDVEEEWGGKEKKGKVIPESRKESLYTIKDLYNEVFPKLDAFVKRLFSSSQAQIIFKKYVGQEVHSLDEAITLRFNLIKPFAETFESSKPEPTKHRPKDSEAFQQAEEKVLRKVTEQDPNWQTLLVKLQYLPGNHHEIVNDCISDPSSKSLKSLLSYGKVESQDRFSKLELSYGQEDLVNLQLALSDANSLISTIQVSRWFDQWFGEKKKQAEKKPVEDQKPVTPSLSEQGRMPEHHHEGLISLDRAQEILVQDFLGPETIQHAFGFTPETIPPIPFSEAELIRAKELGQMLVLRVDHFPDGRPMSLKNMHETLDAKWKIEGKGNLLDTVKRWRDDVKGKQRFNQESIRPGWALVSKDILPNSTSKNYIEQTDLLIEHLKTQVYQDNPLPQSYTDAIQEYESQKQELISLMNSNWQEAARRLSELQITKLLRQTDQEVIYGTALYFDSTNIRLLSNTYTWSFGRSRFGFLVFVGFFDGQGLNGLRWVPRGRGDDVGVLFSRSG